MKITNEEIDRMAFDAYYRIGYEYDDMPEPDNNFETGFKEGFMKAFYMFRNEIEKITKTNNKS